ncbi:hypothetical protein ABZV14_29240 [Streptosporangium canum]
MRQHDGAARRTTAVTRRLVTTAIRGRHVTRPHVTTAITGPHVTTQAA